MFRILIFFYVFGYCFIEREWLLSFIFVENDSFFSSVIGRICKNNLGKKVLYLEIFFWYKINLNFKF